MEQLESFKYPDNLIDLFNLSKAAEFLELE